MDMPALPVSVAPASGEPIVTTATIDGRANLAATPAGSTAPAITQRLTATKIAEPVMPQELQIAAVSQAAVQPATPATHTITPVSNAQAEARDEPRVAMLRGAEARLHEQVPAGHRAVHAQQETLPLQTTPAVRSTLEPSQRPDIAVHAVGKSALAPGKPVDQQPDASPADLVDTATSIDELTTTTVQPGNQKFPAHANTGSGLRTDAFPATGAATRPAPVNPLPDEFRLPSDLATSTTPPVTAFTVAQPTGIRARTSLNPSDIDAIGGTSAPSAVSAAASADSTVLPARHIAIALNAPDWKPAFASSVRMLVNDGVPAAALHLNPAELGPIEVRIQLVDQRASISFTVSNPTAGAAIQSAMADLRDQLAQSGIQLGQTSVGSNGQNPQQPHESTDASTPSTTNAPGNAAPAPRTGSSVNQIDLYA